MIEQSDLDNILRRGVSEIIVKDDFVRLLEEGKPLRLKMGFDPSRPDIHLGHAVGLRKLRQLQDIGHQVVLIVGDWTAQIGDPSGQSATRQMLTAEEVNANAQTYLDQFFKIVDKQRTETVWQSEWFGKFTLANVFDLTRRFTVAQFLARNDFEKRFHAQQPIAITELLYPLLQAYDSVAINSDVEFGGTDQMFNILVGRDLQAMMGQTQQHCFIMPLLVGTDGVQKMSKSLGNYIGIDEKPEEMYGKIMSIPDGLLLDYFELLTDISYNELTEIRNNVETNKANFMELKKYLSLNIVTQFHSRQYALNAQKSFEQIYQRRDIPEDVPALKISFSSPETGPNAEILSRKTESGSRSSDSESTPSSASVNVERLLIQGGLSSSRSDAKRLIAQGGVTINGLVQTDDSAEVKNGDVIRVGRHRFLRIEDIDTHN